MKKKTKIILSVLLILLSAEVGSRIYKHSITDVRVVNPLTEQERYYYNGNEYINLDSFIKECIAKGVLFEDAYDTFPRPYSFIWGGKSFMNRKKNFSKKYVKGYDSLNEKLWDPFEYVYINKTDKDKNLMVIYDHQDYYIRKDFVFPSVETNKVEAIAFEDIIMDNMIMDKQVIADFMEAIYEKGEATDKITEYLDKEHDTYIYFKYEGCDCAVECIGRFSLEDGKFTMEKDINYSID